MKEAMYYEKLDEAYVKCKLCPHSCVIEDGNVGTCRVRKNDGGILYTLNYGKISAYGYDRIEKKPLYHFYPNSTIFSIGSFGCNLACDFCQNHEIVYDSSYSQDIEENYLMELASGKDSIGLAFTYNEPSIWYEYMLDIAKKTHTNGLKNVMVTNGYINEEPLKELLPFIDAMNIDLKSMKNAFYKGVCGGSLDPVLRTIELANSNNVHVEVTTLLIEDANSGIEEMKLLGKKLSSIDRTIPLHLNRYFPAHKMELQATSIEVLIEAREILKEYLDYVYIGNLSEMDNSTYCPGCGAIIVNRDMMSRITNIENKKCSKCGVEINIEY